VVKINNRGFFPVLPYIQLMTGIRTGLLYAHSTSVYIKGTIMEVAELLSVVADFVIICAGAFYIGQGIGYVITRLVK
jgi:hypothetical protein